MNIKKVLEIAESINKAPDGRPEWLQRCRETDHHLATYYRFLYELSRELHPAWTLETGTRLGQSAAQLAMGCQTSTVITIDIDPLSKGMVCRHPEIGRLKNMIAITSDSRVAMKEFPKECKAFDLVFLDSDHTYDVALSEFRLYEPMLRPGGVMVFDDITLNSQMRQFWKEVPGPKVELNFLHLLEGAGFGAYVKPE